MHKKSFSAQSLGCACAPCAPPKSVRWVILIMNVLTNGIWGSRLLNVHKEANPGSFGFVGKLAPGFFYQGREIFCKTERENLPSTLLKLLELLHQLFISRRPKSTFVYHCVSQINHLFISLSLSIPMMVPMSK